MFRKEGKKKFFFLTERGNEFKFKFRFYLLLPKQRFPLVWIFRSWHTRDVLSLPECANRVVGKDGERHEEIRMAPSPAVV